MCAGYLYLKKLLGDILDPAELSGTASPGVLPEADQLLLYLLSVQSCHCHWLRLSVNLILQINLFYTDL